ncbi:TetR family transcriptional regulator [Spongisporangium articulatum]|uniref:TetR family transcriptional regulator n=1 Tax=Spongisporangium articulatum TaxID=3362603 RepID=A0ABW8AQP3_9ACTN
MTEAPRRRGRRPAGEDARGAILEAARGEFGSKGYDGTTFRGVARAAGVDARLVHHYFDGKDALFVAALELPVRPADLVAAVAAGGREGVGARLVLTLVSVWDSPAGRDRIIAFLSGALSSDAGRRMLREFVTREIFGRLGEIFELDRPHWRAGLAASQLIGLAMARAVVGIEALAAAEPSELAAVIGPTLDHYLFADLP